MIGLSRIEKNIVDMKKQPTSIFNKQILVLLRPKIVLFIVLQYFHRLGASTFSVYLPNLYGLINQAKSVNSVSNLN